jgi:hypothetical protein
MESSTRPDGREAGIAPILAAAKRFGRYKSEDEKSVRTENVQQNEALERLTDIWKRFEKREVTELSADVECQTYYHALFALEGVAFGPKEVEAFSLILGGLRNEGQHFAEEAGGFLSAMINLGDGKEFVVHTGNLDRAPDWLGYRNTKSIIVEGDCGNLVGNQQEGRMLVMGSVGNNAGRKMHQGVLYVDGDAGMNLGYMAFGTIIVIGDAGDYVGKEACGEIHVGGNMGIAARDEMDGIRRIYHKGTLILPRQG